MNSYTIKSLVGLIRTF